MWRMSRLKISSMVLSAVMLLLASCTSSKTEAVLNDVETYIKERPDSALATIRAIDTMSLKTPRLRAHFALLHAMALDKNWIDTTDVNIVMPAVEYYDRHPSGIRRAKAWYYLGRIQENGDDIPGASISFLKAERYADPFDDITFKSLVYQAISNVYSKTYCNEEALRYTEMSYELAVQDGDTLGANASLYRMAQDLNNVGRYAESDSLYRILISEKQVYPGLRASLLSNYALGLITHADNYEEAANIFDETLVSYGSLGQANYWGAYAYALAHTGRIAQADTIFKKLSQISRDRSSVFVYSYWKSMADAYCGDFHIAYDSQKNALDLQTENFNRLLEQSAVKAQKDFLEEMNRESERLARRRQGIAWGITASLLTLILVLILYNKRRNKQGSLEKEALIEAYKDLTSRTEEEKAKVRSQYIQMCQSHFSHIGRINEMLNVYANESDDNLYKELKRSIQQIGQDEQSQLRFEKVLDDTFDDVMTHFREAFPKRKQRYYQLVSYIFAGFSTTTICIMIPSYNKHNVHVEKSRLKQMIQDTDSPYKEQFLRMLS